MSAEHLTTPPLRASTGRPVVGATPGRSPRRRWRVTPSQGVHAGTVAVIQHGALGAEGVLLEVLAARGLEPVTVRLDRGEPLPDSQGLSFAVVIGSASADQELSQPWTEAEIEWLVQANHDGLPVFAVGAGAHALALALGGDSAPIDSGQHGWITVNSEDQSLVPAGPWFAWQDRVLRLPPGAQLIARNSVGPQAFRIGPHLGVQFHPGITPELIHEWIPRSPQILDYQGIEEATVRDFPSSQPAARRLFSAFLDTAAA
jgi:GMP synthase-like glutamine amidotransferase